MTASISRRAARGLLDEALAPGALVPSFHSIVDLNTLETVGFESLARWPTILGANPGVVFSLAAAADRSAELDWACRLATLRTVSAADLTGPATLFMNVDSATVGDEPPAGFDERAEAVQQQLPVVLELTERDLLRRPAELLQLVTWARDRGFGVALDNVGSSLDALSLVPFVAPDVIKLDLAAIISAERWKQARVMSTVLSYTEHSGASVLALGIETEEQRQTALALGAGYGQGWLFGRPGLLEPSLPTGAIPHAANPRAVPSTPFELVADSPLLRQGSKTLLMDISDHIEALAAGHDDRAVVVSAFQTAARFTGATARRYAELAEHLPFVGALGQGLTVEPVPGVRGAWLVDGDALLGEWTVVVVGAHYSGALIARDRGDTGPDQDRTFDFVATHDRDLVLAAGRSLMARIAAQA